jgi:hypothetical protein
MQLRGDLRTPSIVTSLKRTCCIVQKQVSGTIVNHTRIEGNRLYVIATFLVILYQLLVPRSGDPVSSHWSQGMWKDRAA